MKQLQNSRHQFNYSREVDFSMSGSKSVTDSSEASNNAYIPPDMKTHIPTTSLHCLSRKLPLSQIHMHPSLGHTAETAHWNRFELPTSQPTALALVL